MKLRREVEAVLTALLQASETSGELSLDEVGEAVGVMAITAEEIDVLLMTLESRGRRVIAPEGGGGPARLRAVLDAARTLKVDLGRSPTPAEIAQKAALPIEEVRRALMLAQVMGR